MDPRQSQACLLPSPGSQEGPQAVQGWVISNTLPTQDIAVQNQMRTNFPDWKPRGIHCPHSWGPRGQSALEHAAKAPGVSGGSNWAPKGPFCFLSTEPETMPGVRHALDFSAARGSNTGSGSARVEWSAGLANTLRVGFLQEGEG